MTPEDAPYIVSVDRLNDSIIIGFADGRCGRYSAVLLYGMLSQSEELSEPAVVKNPDEAAASLD